MVIETTKEDYKRSFFLGEKYRHLSVVPVSVVQYGVLVCLLLTCIKRAFPKGNRMGKTPMATV